MGRIKKFLIWGLALILVLNVNSLAELVKVEKAEASGSIILAAWNFPNNPDDNVADEGTPANANKTIQVVGANAPTFNTNGATTRSARAIGWDNGTNIKYWLIDVNTVGYQDIKISSKQRSSSTGPRDFRLQYSINGSIWNDVGDAIVIGDNYTSGVLSNLVLLPDANNQSSLRIRWLMISNIAVNNGLVLSSGASNIDDVAITGTQDITLPSNANLSLADQGSGSTAYTDSQIVNASIANDTDATAWLLSEAQFTQPSASDLAWQTSKPATFNLSAGDTLKTVYIWTKDAAENVSNLGNSAQITLDTQAPTIQITRDPDKDLANTDCTLTVNFGDSIQIMQYNLDETGWTDYASAVIVSAEGFHTFVAHGTDAAGNSGLASASFTIDKIAPATPSSFSASVADGNVTLSWEAVSDADHYEIWRSSSPWVLIAVILKSQNTYPDRGVERGKTYQYRIVAVDEAGNGSIETFVSIMVPALKPIPNLATVAQAAGPMSALGVSTFPSTPPSVSPSSSPSGTVSGEKDEGTETKGTNYRYLYWLIPILVILIILFLLWWWRRRKDEDDEYKDSEEI